ncbi:MAG: transporter substrate-binding domain-containing protein [Spirochaetota bacterium]
MRFRLRCAAALLGTLAAVTACSEAPNELAAQPSSRPVSGAGRLDEVLERGVLRVGTTGDFYLSQLDEKTGERRGYDIDLTSRLAKDMGVEVEYVATDWPSLVSGLTSGRYDITTGATYTAARARAASYTLPTARTGTVAVVRRTDRERFNAWSAIDGAGVRVAVTQGSIFQEQAHGIASAASIETVASRSSLHETLLAGRADVAITGLVDAAALVSAQDALVIAPAEPKHASYMAMLVPPGAHELRAFVDAWIRSKQHSGYMDELGARWKLGL